MRLTLNVGVRACVRFFLFIIGWSCLPSPRLSPGFSVDIINMHTTILIENLKTKEKSDRIAVKFISCWAPTWTSAETNKFDDDFKHSLAENMRFNAKCISSFFLRHRPKLHQKNSVKQSTFLLFLHFFITANYEIQTVGISLNAHIT